MDGVHDMGGMHGFGPIEREDESDLPRPMGEAGPAVATAFTRGLGPATSTRRATARADAAVRLLAVELLRALAGGAYQDLTDKGIVSPEERRLTRERASTGRTPPRRRPTRRVTGGLSAGAGAAACVPANIGQPRPAFCARRRGVDTQRPPARPHPPAALRPRQARPRRSRPRRPYLSRHQRPWSRPPAPAAVQRPFRGCGAVGRVGRGTLAASTSTCGRAIWRRRAR